MTVLHTLGDGFIRRVALFVSLLEKPVFGGGVVELPTRGASLRKKKNCALPQHVRQANWVRGVQLLKSHAMEAIANIFRPKRLSTG